MIHLKDFSQLFEASSDRRIFTHEEIKSLPGYQELINRYGYIDTTTPIISKSGNLRFEHPDFANEYTIYSNGYIRQQSGPYNPWYNPNITKKGVPSVLIRHGGESQRDFIFGGEIENLEDYEIKFTYLKDYYIKKTLKDLGLNKKNLGNAKIDLPDLSDLSVLINKRLASDPGAIPIDRLKSLEKSGRFVPDESSKSIMRMGDIGFFD